LAKTIIARRIQKESSIIFARLQHASRGWSGLVYLGPAFWGKGGHRESAMVPFERALVASYRLSTMTIALSLTIRPQFAIQSLRRSN